MKTTQMFLIATAGLLSFVSTAAGNGILYGSSYNPGVDSSLYTINTSTGALTDIGSTGLTDIGDLASNQTSILWGVQLTTDDLVTFNPKTGTGTAGPTITGTGLSASVPITSIAWDPVTGILYGNSDTGYGATRDSLYSINTATGAATLIGSIGFSDVYALGFAQNGTLWGVEDYDGQGTLFSISLTTGAGTSVGNSGLSGIFDVASDPAASSGLYAADGNTNALYSFNTSTAGATEIGAYGSAINIAGLAFLAPGSALSTPEPDTLALMLGAAALVWVYRKAAVRFVGRVKSNA